MKITKLTWAALAVLSFSPAMAADGWMTDFEAAKKKAAKENKSLLLDFTGSDWCPPCKRLTSEVLGQEDFIKAAKEHFVLVELDFPRNKEQPDDLKQQNQDLQQRYGIQGYPTILLTAADGKPYGQTGYRPGGVEKYLEHLTELRGKKKDLDAAFAKADKLKGVEKAKALVTAVKLLPEAQQSFYSDVIDEIAELDPKDETGFVKAQKTKKAMGELDGKLNELFNEKDYAGMHKVVDDFIKEHKPEGEMHQQALFMKMSVYIQEKDFDAAKSVLDEVEKIDPNSNVAQMVPRVKAYIEQQIGEEKPAEDLKEKEAEKKPEPAAK